MVFDTIYKEKLIMNTSFSKKRHINEVNSKLENRFLNEQGRVLPKLEGIDGIATTIYNEINDKVNSDERRIVQELQRLKSADEFSQMQILYSKKYNKLFNTDLYKAISDGEVNEIKQIQDYLKTLGITANFVSKAQARDIQTKEKKLVVPGWSFSTPQVSGQKQDGGTTDKKVAGGQPAYTSENDPQFPKTTGILTIPNDPWQYMVKDCVWYARRGKNRIKDWKSLSGKIQAEQTLDKKFPDARKNCPKTEVGSEVTSRETITAPAGLQASTGGVQSTQGTSVAAPQIGNQYLQSTGQDYQKRFAELKRRYPTLSTQQINQMLVPKAPPKEEPTQAGYATRKEVGQAPGA